VVGTDVSEKYADSIFRVKALLNRRGT